MRRDQIDVWSSNALILNQPARQAASTSVTAPSIASLAIDDRRIRTMSRLCFWLPPLALLLTLDPVTPADDVQDMFDGRSLNGWVVAGPST